MDAHKDEPSPIHWSPQQQSQAEPPPPMSSNFQDQMMKFMSKMDHEVSPGKLYPSILR